MNGSSSFTFDSLARGLADYLQMEYGKWDEVVQLFPMVKAYQKASDKSFITLNLQSENDANFLRGVFEKLDAHMTEIAANLITVKNKEVVPASNLKDYKVSKIQELINA